MEDIEQVLKPKSKKKEDKSNPTRIRKEFVQTVKKSKPRFRHLVVGCTSNPAETNKKEIQEVFKKNRLYFPLPEASSLKMIWMFFITK